MRDITRILGAIERGEPQAAAHLLPLVYEELRRLATQKMAHEAPGQTLQATALVHEAYLRLTATQQISNWNNRGHFFAAAAEARRKRALKRDGVRMPLEASLEDPAAPRISDDVLALHAALEKLEQKDPSK